jgi:hypothetical protein
MHDAMADRGDAIATTLLRMPFEQRGKRALVRALLAIERCIVQRVPPCIAHAQPCLQPGAEAIGLPRPARSRQRIALFALLGRRKQRDLDRRRPGVQREQRFGQT